MVVFRSFDPHLSHREESFDFTAEIIVEIILKRIESEDRLRRSTSELEFGAV